MPGQCYRLSRHSKNPRKEKNYATQNVRFVRRAGSPQPADRADWNSRSAGTPAAYAACVPTAGSRGEGGGPEAQRAPDGTWYMPEGAQSMSPNHAVVPLAVGGPDDFGYTWDDSVALNWIDATGGTDTGLSGDGWNNATGPISLPFSFKYYENTYSQVYITATGYLGFTDYGYWDDQSEIPNSNQPNNVIAPYWTPTYIGAGSWVHYTSGGSLPNRYFVVEWHDVKGGNPSDTIGNDDTYRFEVVLYESGDIVFQY